MREKQDISREVVVERLVYFTKKNVHAQQINLEKIVSKGLHIRVSYRPLEAILKR